MTRRLRAATRGSALALWQANHVAALVRDVEPGCEVEPVVVETTADRRLDIPISAMGGKGVFVKEVQAALLDGRADIAVHSAKDLPSTVPEGLTLAAIPQRADPRDVLVGRTLTQLGPGAHVATGSARRRVQLASARPDLRFSGLRGNIATRLGRLDDFDAILMAKAALDRLGLSPDVVDVFDVDFLIPQVGQGALALECRVDDLEVTAMLAKLDHAPSRRAVDAERAFLAELGGDCNLPAGAYATVDGDAISLSGVLASPDESVVCRALLDGTDPEALGCSLARQLRDEVQRRTPST